MAIAAPATPRRPAGRSRLPARHAGSGSHAPPDPTSSRDRDRARRELLRRRGALACGCARSVSRHQRAGRTREARIPWARPSARPRGEKRRAEEVVVVVNRSAEGEGSWCIDTWEGSCSTAVAQVSSGALKHSLVMRAPRLRTGSLLLVRPYASRPCAAIIPSRMAIPCGQAPRQLCSRQPAHAAAAPPTSASERYTSRARDTSA